MNEKTTKAESGYVDKQTLRDLRESVHLDQAELARKADISIDTLRRLERGETRTPRYQTVEKLLEKIGVDRRSWLAALEETVRSRTSHDNSPVLSSESYKEVTVAPERVVRSQLFSEKIGRESDGVADSFNFQDQGIEILARIRAWAGGDAEALFWYLAEPIPAFGDRTAESLVKSGQASALRDYLDSIALGGFA